MFGRMLRVIVAVATIAVLGETAVGDDVRRPGAPPPPKQTGVVTKQPKLLQAVAPEYPPAALAANKEAKVKVRIHIDATGVVDKVDVIDKVGDGFDEAAVAAAMQYVFEPAEIDGKPAPIAVETTINFVIEQQTEQEPPPTAPPTKDKTGPPNHAGAMTDPISIEGV